MIVFETTLDFMKIALKYIFQTKIFGFRMEWIWLQ